MQTRVVELIPQLVDEGFIEELLVVNDDLNNAFIRYERCVGASLEGILLSFNNIPMSISSFWFNADCAVVTF